MGRQSIPRTAIPLHEQPLSAVYDYPSLCGEMTDVSFFSPQDDE
jgi:hypothetical protein